MVLESEQAVNLVDKPYNALDFGRDLFLSHEDVRIILSEASYAHKTVKLAALFVAVNKSQLAYSHRQIPVRARFRLINQHSAGAVHRLNCVIGIVDNGGVHILLIVIPVTGSLPKVSIQDDRR